MNQYPYMTDVSGMNNGMQDTRSQDALHQALLLRSSQMNPQTQPTQQNSNMLAQILRQGNKQKLTNSTNPTNQNSANVYDYSTPYDPNQYTGIDSYLNGTSGIDNSALGGYDTSGLSSFDLGGAGSSLDSLGGSLDGIWQGIGSIGDWFGSLFGSGGALEGAGAAAEEAAPVAAAAA
jgi:hypothetical protein